MTPLDYFRFLGYIVLNNANNHVINLMSRDNSHRLQLINHYVTISVIINENYCLKSCSYRYNEDVKSVITEMLNIKKRIENESN